MSHFPEDQMDDFEFKDVCEHCTFEMRIWRSTKDSEIVEMADDYGELVSFNGSTIPLIIEALQRIYDSAFAVEDNPDGGR